MRTLDANETEKVESWLDRVELFLMELQATDRAQIILDLNQQIQAQVIASSDIRIDELLKKMGEPVQVANRVRMERGLKPRARIAKPRTMNHFLILSILGVLFLLTTCTLSLPFVVPWGLNRLVMKLGQPPESFRYFSHGFRSWDSSPGEAPETNEDEEADETEAPQANIDDPPKTGMTGGQENINGSFQSEGMNSILIRAKNIKLVVGPTKNTAIEYDCKISNLAFARPFIRKSPSGKVTLALDQVSDSAVCELKVPALISLDIQVNSGEIRLQQMNQDVSVAAGEAELYFSSSDQSRYEIEAKTQKGEVKALTEFEKKQMSFTGAKKHKAIFNIDSGNIHFETK